MQLTYKLFKVPFVTILSKARDFVENNSGRNAMMILERDYDTKYCPFILERFVRQGLHPYISLRIVGICYFSL